MLELPSLLRSDPAAVTTMPAEHLPALLLDIASIQSRLAAASSAISARLLAEAAATSGNASEALLNVREAAIRLNVSVDWLYRHAKRLPFTRRVGSRAVRFDPAGLVRWLAHRTPRRGGSEIP
jgi:predicted DNA-binding transcriptional regulator AlpA